MTLPACVVTKVLCPSLLLSLQYLIKGASETRKKTACQQTIFTTAAIKLFCHNGVDQGLLTKQNHGSLGKMIDQ